MQSPTIGTVALLALAAYYAAIVLWVRATASRGVEASPRTQPPYGISAVEAGELWREFRGGKPWYDRAFLVVLTSLALRGAVRVRVAGGFTVDIERAVARIGTVPEPERRTLEQLFPDGSPSIRGIPRHYDRGIENLRFAPFSADDTPYQAAPVNRHLGLWRAGWLGVAIVVLDGIVLNVPLKLIVAALIPSALALIGTLVASVLAGAFVREAWRARRSGRHAHWGLLSGMCLAGFFAGMGGFFLSSIVGTQGVVIAMTAVGLTVLSSDLLVVPTAEGDRILKEIDAYRHWLAETVEEGDSRLSPDAYRHLPYALALGVEERWVDRAEAMQRTGKLRLPDDWLFRGERPVRDPRAVCRLLTINVEQTIATASTRPPND